MEAQGTSAGHPAKQAQPKPPAARTRGSPAESQNCSTDPLEAPQNKSGVPLTRVLAVPAFQEPDSAVDGIEHPVPPRLSPVIPSINGVQNLRGRAGG